MYLEPCRLKMSPQNVKLDLHFNGEILSTSEDRKLVGQIPLKDRAVMRFSFVLTLNDESGAGMINVGKQTYQLLP